MSKSGYVAIAERDGRWWGIEVLDGNDELVGVTQCRHLSEAREWVRSMIEAMENRTLSEDLEIELHLAGLDDAIEMVREQQREAEEMQRVASASARALARRMVTEEGIPQADVATALGVSRQRVGQLVS